MALSSRFFAKNQFFELKTFSIPIVKNKRLFLTISRYFLILNFCPLKKNKFLYDDICDDNIFLQWTLSLKQRCDYDQKSFTTDAALRK